MIPSDITSDMKLHDQETPEEVWDDVISMCCKIAHDAEMGKVWVHDLDTLKIDITTIKKLVGQGAGYKAFPKLSREPP